MPDKLHCFFDKPTKLVDKGIEWMERNLDSISQTHVQKDLAWKFNSNYLSGKDCHTDGKLNEKVAVKER